MIDTLVYLLTSSAVAELCHVVIKGINVSKIEDSHRDQITALLAKLESK